MNKAKPLFDAFGKAIQTRGGTYKNQKNCVEVFVKEVEKLVTQFDEHTPEWWAYRLNEIREDLKEL